MLAPLPAPERSLPYASQTEVDIVVFRESTMRRFVDVGAFVFEAWNLSFCTAIIPPTMQAANRS